MTEAREMPLWLNNTWLGYIDVKKCRAKKAPFFFDLNHRPIYVDHFCSLTRLKRNTWRQSISVEKPDGEIVPALPLITPPNPLHSPARDTNRQVRRRPTASARRERAARQSAQAPPAAPPARSTGVEYFSGLFSIARPPSQEAREAAREAAAAYLAEVDAREATRQEEARAAAYMTDDRRAAVAEGIRTATRVRPPPQAPATRPAAPSISEREMHLITLADVADLPISAAREEKVCVICHEDLMRGQRLAATGCGHVFCTGCISMSLRHKDVCPTCRSEEPSVTVLYI
jgi:hypothetical protein